MHLSRASWALWQRAIKDVSGSAGFSLMVVFTAFGASLKAAGLDILQSIAMNVFIYAIPGQLVALNSIARELSLLSTVLLILAINIRLLPMSLSVSHLLGRGRESRTLYYFSSYFVAVTGWLNFITNHRHLGKDDVFSYYLYTSCILWCYAILGFFIGYYVVIHLSDELFIALLLVNPLYFLAVVALHGRDDGYLAIAVTSGCLLYLMLYSWFGPSTIIVAGILGGTSAFVARLYNKRGAGT